MISHLVRGVLKLLHQDVNVECTFVEVGLHRATFLPIVVRSICI
jgi:hypothetical protein